MSEDSDGWFNDGGLRAALAAAVMEVQTSLTATTPTAGAGASSSPVRRKPVSSVPPRLNRAKGSPSPSPSPRTPSSRAVAVVRQPLTSLTNSPYGPAPSLPTVVVPHRHRRPVVPARPSVTPSAVPLPPSDEVLEGLFKARQLYHLLRREMDAFRDSMPLKFLAGHPMFSKYVSLRTAAALRLILAAIWENRVGNALDQWKSLVRVGRMKAAMLAKRQKRAVELVSGALTGWRQRLRAFDLDKAWHQWCAYSAWRHHCARVSAAMVFQPAVRGWLGRRFVKQCREERRREQVARHRLLLWWTTVRIWRMFQAKRRAAGLIRRWWCFQLKMRWNIQAMRAAATCIQTAFRRHYTASYYALLRNAASVVSRAWRFTLGYRLKRVVIATRHQMDDMLWACAADIQRVYRGHVARKAAGSQRTRNTALHWCATRVQAAWYRRNNMFSAFVLLRSLVVQHEFDVERDAAAMSHVRRCAASTIQAAWRGLGSRRRMYYLYERTYQATAIQKWWRREVFGRRVEPWVSAVGAMLEHSRYARDIQRVWWRAKPGRLLASLRARVALMRSEAKRRQDELERVSATAIQALGRGWMGRTVATLRRADVLCQHISARRVTRCVRAAARKAITRRLVDAYTAAWMAAGQTAAVAGLAARCHAAALRIQTVARQRLARNELARRRAAHAAAAAIQSAWFEFRLRQAALLVLQARRRDVVNPFRRVRCPLRAIREALPRANAQYDPLDADANLYIRAVCRRLCLPIPVGAALVRSGIRGLTTLIDCDETELEAAGVTDARHREALMALADARDRGWRGGVMGDGVDPVELATQWARWQKQQAAAEGSDGGGASALSATHHATSTATLSTLGGGTRAGTGAFSSTAFTTVSSTASSTSTFTPSSSLPLSATTAGDPLSATTAATVNAATAATAAAAAAATPTTCPSLPIAWEFAFVNDPTVEYTAWQADSEASRRWVANAYGATPVAVQREAAKAAGDRLPRVLCATQGLSNLQLRRYLHQHGQDIKSMKQGWRSLVRPPPRTYTEEELRWDIRRVHRSLRTLFAAAEHVLNISPTPTCATEVVQDAVRRCVRAGVPTAPHMLDDAKSLVLDLRTALDTFAVFTSAATRMQAVFRMRRAMKAAAARKVQRLHAAYLREQKEKLSMDAVKRWEQFNEQDNAAWQEYHDAVHQQHLVHQADADAARYRAAVEIQRVARGMVYRARVRAARPGMLRRHVRRLATAQRLDVTGVMPTVDIVVARVASRASVGYQYDGVSVGMWLARIGLRSLVRQLRRRHNRLPASNTTPSVLDMKLSNFFQLSRRKLADAGVSQQPLLATIMAARQQAQVDPEDPAAESRLVWNRRDAEKEFLRVYPGQSTAAFKFGRSVVSLLSPPSLACLRAFCSKFAKTDKHAEQVQELAVGGLADLATVDTPGRVRKAFAVLTSGADLVRTILAWKGMPTLSRVLWQAIQHAELLFALPRQAGVMKWETLAFDAGAALEEETDNEDEDGVFDDQLDKDDDSDDDHDDEWREGGQHYHGRGKRRRGGSSMLEELLQDDDGDEGVEESKTGSEDAASVLSSSSTASTTSTSSTYSDDSSFELDPEEQQRLLQDVVSDGEDSDGSAGPPPATLAYKRRLFDDAGLRVRRRAAIDDILAAEMDGGPDVGAGGGGGGGGGATRRMSADRRSRNPTHAAAPLILPTRSIPAWFLNRIPIHILELCATELPNRSFQKRASDADRPWSVKTNRRPMTVSSVASGATALTSTFMTGGGSRPVTASTVGWAPPGTPAGVVVTSDTDWDIKVHAVQALDLRRCERHAARLVRETLAALETLSRQAVVLQAHVRRRQVRRWYFETLALRNSSARLIQWGWAGFAGRCVARALRLVRYAKLEQCWDPDTNAFFYFDTETGKSIWEAPPEATPFRPSGWWVLPTALPSGKCCVCRTADSDRMCNLCTFDDELDELEQDPYKGLGFQKGPPGARVRPKEYCFMCFTTTHRYSRELRAHQFHLTDPPSVEPVTCVECGEFGTRYCWGCTDAYCADHYDALHRKGKRASHAYQEFKPGCLQCAQCLDRVAVRTCNKCLDSYCNECATTTHLKGRKRLHSWTAVDYKPEAVEEAEEAEEATTGTGSGKPATAVAVRHDVDEEGTEETKDGM